MNLKEKTKLKIKVRLYYFIEKRQCLNEITWKDSGTHGSYNPVFNC
jgi:hypothetical protein